MRPFPASASVSAAAALVLLASVSGSDPYASSYQSYNTAMDQTIDAHAARRERNLDHWDGETLAAYLGMDPETGEPLPDAGSDPDAGSISPTGIGAGESQRPQRVDEYVGHDAAILFYAQWCPNCHALAPNYDAIATLLGAGTVKSNLIMALFDCERDAQHAMLCSAAGVKHYPTVMFIGSGPFHDTDPISKALLGKDKSAGPAGASKLRRAVKFQGDWRYGDQVMDWIKCMRGLSSWHRLNTQGFMSVLRRGIFDLFRGGKGGRGIGGKNDSLPVGVPPGFMTSTTGGGVTSGPSSYILDRKIKALEGEVERLENGREELSNAMLHASYIMESFLFPVEPKSTGADAGEGQTAVPPPYVDVFAALSTTGAWEAKEILTSDGTNTNADPLSTDPADKVDPYLLKNCAVDLTLDYCTRLTTRDTTAFLDELMNADPNAPYPSLLELDELLQNRTANKEPYCAKFETCFADEFKGEGCRPSKCPFRNDMACRYIGACLDPNIRGEYAEALGKLAAQKKEAGGSAEAVGTGPEVATEAGKGGWGF